MAKQIAVLENGLNGKEATVEIRPIPNSRRSVVIVKKEVGNMEKQPYDSENLILNATDAPRFSTTEIEGVKAEEKHAEQKSKQKQKKGKESAEKGTAKIGKDSAKPELNEQTQKILDFLRTLDHPATSNEVRDHFHFKLRAPARKAFRKLEKLGYGKNIKGNAKYHFHIKDMTYAELPKKVE
jgi:hypothetical protein